jgi:RNA-directed DNA polymerase
MQSLELRLADAFLAGPWEVEGLVDRGARLLGRHYRWLRRTAIRIHGMCPAGRLLRRRQIAELISADASFVRAWDRYQLHARAVLWTTRPPIRPAIGPPAGWSLPTITTPGTLAEWLGLPPNVLEWFADCQSRERRLPDGPLRHYRYRWQTKRHGEARLIEVPKPRLKFIQRELLHAILDRLPPHPAAHGFVAGRSVKTFAEPHCGQPVVLRMDLRDFFPSITAARVLAIFQTAGYPEAVAGLLAGLCTNWPASAIFDEMPGLQGYGQGIAWQFGQMTQAPNRSLWRAETLYARPHLPQGAPTSPALANLAAFWLDCRLAALAESMGAIYTRYADDLAFSGERGFARAHRRFHAQVAAIALDEGFEVNTRKTRLMLSSVRQRLAGVVVNRHPNVPRDDYDRLKAVLCNCVRHGPASQNRERRADFRAHLAGAIAYVGMLNAARGQRLRAVFDRIVWPDGS